MSNHAYCPIIDTHPIIVTCFHKPHTLQTRTSPLTTSFTMPKQTAQEKKVLEKCELLHQPTYAHSTYYPTVFFNALASNKNLLATLLHGTLENKDLEQKYNLLNTVHSYLPFPKM